MAYVWVLSAGGKQLLHRPSSARHPGAETTLILVAREMPVSIGCSRLGFSDSHCGMEERMILHFI